MTPETSTERPTKSSRLSFEPREIEQDSPASLRIKWADEVESLYAAAPLRRACPCAQCVNEWTGERTLRPDSISDAIEITDAEIVGRYALAFGWSDGHRTGIYSFRYLRELADAKN